MDALTPERRMQIEGRQVSSSQVMPIFGTYYVKDTADLLAEVDRLRADNDSLKVDAVNWGAWRERVAAEFFQSERFGMNDIWIAISALIRQRDEAKRQIVNQQANNHERNAALDALHYVWCDGGCEGGIHRFGEHPPLAQEIVEAAVRNTSRLIGWFVNRGSRDNGHQLPEWAERYAYFAHAHRAQELERQIAAMREAIRKAECAMNCASLPKSSLACSEPSDKECGWSLNTFLCKTHSREPYPPCNCWKSRALAALNPDPAPETIIPPSC